MCYPKPGPRCAPHARNSFRAADRRWREAAGRAKIAADGVRAVAPVRTADPERFNTALESWRQAERESQRARVVREWRRRALDATAGGVRDNWARADALAAMGRHRDAAEARMRAEAGANEHEQRLWAWREHNGGDGPRRRTRGAPAHDEIRPDGRFDADTGWDGFEQTETETMTAVLHARADRSWAERAGVPGPPTEGMEVLLRSIRDPAGYENLRRAADRRGVPLYEPVGAPA